MDSSGDLYIADSLNYRVRRVKRDGTISTVAGNGKFGNSDSGDGGPAIQARLNEPQGVAVDSAGNLFISDTGFQRIRKVAVDGNISTVAGNGTFGYSGDGGPATEAQVDFPGSIIVGSDGRIYVADFLNNCIRVSTPTRVRSGSGQ